MNTSSSILNLILEASLVVQIVMAILLILAFLAWVWIFIKQKELRQAEKMSYAFENDFWNSDNLSQLYQTYSVKTDKLGMHNIFSEAFEGYIRLGKVKNSTPALRMDGVQRAMRVSLLRQQEHYQKGLSLLATIASSSPYIGLFGTVWGIMNSFLALSGATQATLQSVAPGIAEALIATAFGLFAAIPAVIGYNRFVNKSESLVQNQQAFAEELYSLLNREAHA